MVMDWLKKVADIIMPIEPVEDEEEVQVRNEDRVEEKVAAKSSVASKKVATGGGSYKVEKITSDNGTTSVEGMRYTAYSEPAPSPTARPSLTVVKPHDLTVKIYSPENFDQVVPIADDILQKKAALVNYEQVMESEQRRISDFVNGVCYISDGSVSMISDKIFLYMPNGVEAGEVARVANSLRMR